MLRDSDFCDCGRRIIADCACNLRPSFRCDEDMPGFGGLHPHHHQEDTDGD